MRSRRARTQSGGLECLVNMYSVIDVSPLDDYPSRASRNRDARLSASACVCLHACTRTRARDREEGATGDGRDGWKLSAYLVARMPIVAAGELGTGPTTRRAFFRDREIYRSYFRQIRFFTSRFPIFRSLLIDDERLWFRYEFPSWSDF